MECRQQHFQGLFGSAMFIAAIQDKTHHVYNMTDHQSHFALLIGKRSTNLVKQNVYFTIL